MEHVEELLRSMMGVATMFLCKVATMCMGLNLLFDFWFLGTNWEHKIGLLHCIVAHSPVVFLMQVRDFWFFGTNWEHKITLLQCCC